MQRRWIAAIGMVLAMGLGRAEGALYFDPVTWSNGVDVLGWFSKDTVATAVSAPGAGGNPDGYLLMRFDPGDPGLQRDVLATTNAGFSGNYASYGSALGVRFSFLGYASSAQSLYFQSSAAGGSTWVFDFAPTAHAWEDWTLSLGTSNGWTALPGSVNTDFPTALQQVDLIGFAVGHLNDGTGGFDYGVDNWQLFVPEPGDAATLAMALLAVAFFSRRRIGQLLDRRRPLLMPAGDRSSARVTWTAFLRLSTLHACRSCSERAGEERVRVSATTRLPMALCTVTALPALSAGAIDEPHLFASSCDACRLTHGAAEGQLTAVQGSWLGYAYNNALTNMDVQSFLKCPANGCQKSACQASCTSQHGSGGSENG